ncbi:MAG: sulfatase [Acidobacteriota bacterium]
MTSPTERGAVGRLRVWAVRLLPLLLLLALACTFGPGGVDEAVVLVQEARVDLLASPDAVAHDPFLRRRDLSSRDKRSFAPYLRLDAIDVPDDADHLRMQGVIWPRNPDDDWRDLEPVTFRVRIDGVDAGRHVVRAAQHTTRFTVDVPLPASLRGRAGVEATLSILREDGRAAVGRWLEATLRSTTRVRRQPAGEGRNLLLLVVDTLRADHLGLYGYDRPTSPHLDRFAAEALVFEDAISQAPWTMPSMASIMTGLYPQEHGVIHGEPIGRRHTLLAEPLQRAGLSTFALSTNPLLTRSTGFAQGIETFLELPWARAPKIHDRFLDWLDAQQGFRWFAWLHYMEPHDPYSAPGKDGRRFVDPDYDGAYRDMARLNDAFHAINFGGTPEHPLGSADLTFLRGAYDGEIASWDRAFGALIEALAARGELEQTVIAITSDHGEEFMEHGRLKHGHQLYDESVRVPLILWAPGRVPAVRRDAQVETRRLPRALWRLMGIDAEGAEPTPDDLLVIADGASAEAYSHTMHQPKPGVQRSIELIARRTSGDKAIAWLAGGPRYDGRAERYDLDRDPQERQDLLADDPAGRGAVTEMLRQWHQRRSADRAEGAADPGMLDPEVVEQLRALGYIQ